MIYLDSNATTPTDPRVLEAMMPFLTKHFANPSSGHAGGRLVHKAVEQAREQVAALIDCEPNELIFTSGGTEANNAAIGSALTLQHPRKTHLITFKTEHSSVLEPARRWTEVDRSVSFLDVSKAGIPCMEELKGCARAGQTALVSMMWANNETGVVAPVEAAAELTHAIGAMYHCDAVQAVGKVPVSVKKVPVDYLTLSGHKFHAPKGIGALFISKRVRFRPWILGGGQEFGRRSGTENVPHIVGLGKAAELMRQHLEEGGSARVAAMRDAFEGRLLAMIPELQVNGSVEHRLPGTTSLVFPDIDATGLLILLDERGIACSEGSACHAETLQPSHVLCAMGFDPERLRSTLRFSFSRMNTEGEALIAAEKVIECVTKMKSLNEAGLVRVNS
ncbi:MAG: cysteine desulfurase family protein [Verrucomicrobium sp.]|nr:cysteine desulfurase family protein [Verrucomicrobium sp.]